MKHILLFSIASFLLAWPALGEPLSLNRYLEEVMQKHDQFKSAKKLF